MLQIPTGIPSTTRRAASRPTSHRSSKKRVVRSLAVPSVDGYVFGKVIGQGGYGKVYVCTTTASERNGNRLSKKVAIKVISKQKVRRKDIKKRVVKEIEIHQRLQHKNIVSLLEYKEDKHFIYLVMEYCGGGDMYKLFRSKQSVGLGEKLTAKFISQLASGVAYLHKHRIMHRDLKLSNLLLTEDGNLKIGDFGLAVLLEFPGEEHYTMCGTPNYIAPEVASINKLQHGMPTDLWAIGVVMYSLIVGRLPFKSGTSSKTLNRVRDIDYDIPDTVSYIAKDLIQKLIVENPNDRISALDILRHRFVLEHSRNHLHKNGTIGVHHHARRGIREYAKSLTSSSVSSYQSLLDSRSYHHNLRHSTNERSPRKLYRKIAKKAAPTHYAGENHDEHSLDGRRSLPSRAMYSANNTSWNSVDDPQDLIRSSSSTSQTERFQPIVVRHRHSGENNPIIQRKRSDSLETDSTGPSTPLFSGASSSVVSTSLQNRMEDLDVFNTSKQGQEYFRKSYASSRSSRSDNQLKNLPVSVPDRSSRVVYKAHQIKNKIDGQLSSDLLFEASKGVGHRNHGHIYKGFRRANKHKPRKLKFSSDEEDGCSEDEKEVDMQRKKFKSDAAAPITASSGEEPASKQVNPLRDESTSLRLPLIDVGGIKDFKFNLQDGVAEYRSKNGTIDIERQPDGSRLSIDVFDGAHGQIAVYLPSGKLSGVYRRETLPRKYHPIYILGWKINEIVRATTPYLTVSDKPAGVICTLMSNHPFPNFDFRQNDGGCVRLNVMSNVARIRTPRGEWFCVRLTSQYENMLPATATNSGNHVVDVDSMWLPHATQPPGWFEMFSALGRDVNACNRNAVDANATNAKTINFVAKYCLTILRRAQVAQEYCLQLARNKVAEIGNEATSDGWLPDYPFPMTVENNFFSRPNEIDAKHRRQIKTIVTSSVEENPISGMKQAKSGVTVGDAHQSLEMYLFDNIEHASVNAISYSDISSIEGEIDAGGSESIGERVLSNLSTKASLGVINDSTSGENQHVRRIRNVGWVRQTLEGALKFDFEDGISMIYNSNEITYIDVLKGPAEKYTLPSLDESLEHMPDYVRLKIDSIRETVHSLLGI